MLAMNDIKKGVVILHEGEPYVVTSANFSRQQQRRPVMRTTLKNLKTGAVREHSFQQSDKVEAADLERTTAQFLYEQAGQYVLMDQLTYEQREIDQEALGDAGQLLIEGQEVEIASFGDEVVSVDLPIKVERKVIEAPPGIKGDTSTNVMKDITIEGGAKVKAPLFIKEGDTIRIDTRTISYVERV
jgi:elongation factor P